MRIYIEDNEIMKVMNIVRYFYLHKGNKMSLVSLGFMAYPPLLVI